MLDEAILSTINNLITLRYDDCTEEQSKAIKKLLIDSASKGFLLPPGHIYSDILEIDKKFIENISETIYQSIIETLDAYEPEYYPDIGDDIESFINEWLAEELSRPRDFLGSLGIHIHHLEMKL